MDELGSDSVGSICAFGELCMLSVSIHCINDGCPSDSWVNPCLGLPSTDIGGLSLFSDSVSIYALLVFDLPSYCHCETQLESLGLDQATRLCRPSISLGT